MLRIYANSGRCFAHKVIMWGCPIDVGLVDRNLLDGDEIAWLNVYQRRVRKTLAPHLDDGEWAWLLRETREI